MKSMSSSSQNGLEVPPLNLLGYYAGFISRLMALAIDVLIISISFIAITWFLSVTATMLQFRSLLGYSLGAVPNFSKFVDILFGPITAAVFTISYIFIYHAFFWTLTGQTPGKALMGLRVVTLDGHRLSPLRSLIRFIGYGVSGLPLYLGFLWVLVDDRRQGWHDKLSGTFVVYTWAARPDERFLADEIYQIKHLSSGLPSKSSSELHSPTRASKG